MFIFLSLSEFILSYLISNCPSFFLSSPSVFSLYLPLTDSSFLSLFSNLFSFLSISTFVSFPFIHLSFLLQFPSSVLLPHNTILPFSFYLSLPIFYFILYPFLACFLELSSYSLFPNSSFTLFKTTFSPSLIPERAPAESLPEI